MAIPILDGPFGCTVLVGAYAVGSISGGVIHPNEVMNKSIRA